MAQLLSLSLILSVFLLRKTLRPAMLHLAANLTKRHPPKTTCCGNLAPHTDGRTDRRTCTNVSINYNNLVILPSLATVAPKLSLGKFAANLRSLSDTTPANHASALQKKRIESELEAKSVTKNTFVTFT